jgi:DNA-binding transcriptional LysR family regulator
METNQLNGLIALKVVAECKNFTAAAEKLRISPSAVSQAIKQLEDRLGVTLLLRNTRTTSLTDAGKTFFEESGQALDQILASMENLSTVAKKPTGVLRLSLPRSIFPFYLAPLTASFLKKYPGITLELNFDSGSSDIDEKGFDAGIRISDLIAKDMIALKLFGPARYVVAASPGYLKLHGRPKHPKDLISHNCILMNMGQGVYDRWEFENRGKEFEVQVKGNLTLNDSTQTTISALNGVGLIYYLQEAIEPYLHTGELETVLDSYAATSAGYYLYYSKASQLQPKLRAFINHIKESRQKV